MPSDDPVQVIPGIVEHIFQFVVIDPAVICGQVSPDAVEDEVFPGTLQIHLSVSIDLRVGQKAEKPGDVGRAHHTAVRYVSAAGQAKAAKAMISEGFLTEEEEKLYKQARNHRAMSRPQNADPREYKIATGFEALLGYLYLADDRQRLREIAAEAVRIVDAAGK